MKTEHLSPSLIFASLLVLIFCTEEALTYALDNFLPDTISEHARAAFDAGTLTLVMSLCIWWLVMRPLRLALMNESAMAKAVTDAAVDAIIRTDERGTIESFNPAAEKMFGYAAKGAIGKNVAILMSEAHAGEYLHYIADRLRESDNRVTGMSREFLAQREDRGEFPVELTMAVTTLGGVRRFTSIVRDVSERKRMERAARRGAAELRIIIDSVPAMIVYYDASLRCRFANKRYADFFGFDAAGIAGKALRDIVGDAAYPAAEAEFHRAMAGQALTYERTQLRSDGQSVPLEIKMVPHVGENGTPLGVYGLLEDNSGHKAAEENIRRQANQDSVTGLADRTLFLRRLGQEITAARVARRGLALVYLSLGKFKYINDTLGHRVGDQVLMVVAERIRFQARKSDMVARVGGDEFAVLMPAIANRRDAAEIGEKIVAALSKQFYLDGQKRAVQITASAGVAVFGVDAHDADNFVEAAYTAMEKAKHASNGQRQ
jgi:diguanylate cyclase (GGDEF)-like protein/PAS domain S-box-containing protein